MVTEWIINIHKNKHVSATAPNSMTYIDDIDGFQISYLADYPKEKPIFKSDMSIEREQIATCSPSILGTSKLTLLVEANGPAQWGKVDYWDNFLFVLSL